MTCFPSRRTSFALAVAFVATVPARTAAPSLARPRVSVNLRTAAQLRHIWDRAMLADADRTYD